MHTQTTWNSKTDRNSPMKFLAHSLKLWNFLKKLFTIRNLKFETFMRAQIAIFYTTQNLQTTFHFEKMDYSSLYYCPTTFPNLLSTINVFLRFLRKFSEQHFCSRFTIFSGNFISVSYVCISAEISFNQFRRTSIFYLNNTEYEAVYFK